MVNSELEISGENLEGKGEGGVSPPLAQAFKFGVNDRGQTPHSSRLFEWATYGSSA